MSTEILGFFIILGALVVVVLRRNDWHKLLGGDGHGTNLDDVEEASAKLRYELQHSADEIIERMGSHIDHLEHLVAEADRKSAELEKQLHRLQNMQEQQIYTEPLPSVQAPQIAAVAQHDSGIPLQTPAVNEPPPFAEMLEASMTIPGNTNDYARRAFETQPAYEVDPEVVVSPSVADVVGLPLTPEEAAEIEAATAVEPEPEHVDFYEEEASQVQLHKEEQEAFERQAVEEALQLHGGGVSEQVRELLGQGKSVDEIAREVKMGRGAIELIRQMEQNKDTAKNA